MPRQNFISVPVSDTTQAIFDEFVKEMDTTKTAALTDMIELYMLSTNPELFLRLKRKHLKVEEGKGMILSRPTQLVDAKVVSKDYIFMKLGYHPTKNIDAIETLEVYEHVIKKRGYSWFSTSALTFGMSKKQVKYFNNLVNRGEDVRILFAAGENAGGNNDIVASAAIMEIVSYQEKEPSPEAEACPEVFKEEKDKIWIKIRGIRAEEELSVNQFIVKTTGSQLDKVISNSQFQFGYVTRR